MDAIDREAKARGISRATMIAYYQRQREMQGQNGLGQQSDADATKLRQAVPQPKRDPRSAYQRIMDALSGNP